MSDTEAMINVVPAQPPPDPDAATTVHDFLEYTEHLHNDVARSLRLIGTLDHDYHKCTAQLETLCVKYGEVGKNRSQQVAEVNGTGTENWPYSISHQDMGALKLRLSIARKLNEATRDREEAKAESVRLYDNVDRHFNKLSSTLVKLQQIPPPDREPTPPPAPLPDADAQPRITLRVADRYAPRTPLSNVPGRRRKGATYGIVRTGRRPTARREDDWDDAADGERPPKRRGRKPGVGFQPKPLPPPPLTENGEPVDPLSLPWNRLMPHELARLRKRMKKNTQWTPSSTMILRELESLGRGIANKEKFMHQIESDDYPHCSPEDGGIGSLATESNLMTTENRGMKLNAAKRRLKEAQALAAGKLLPGPEGSVDHDTKMEESVVVGPSKPSVYGSKVTIPMGPAPTYSTDISAPRPEASSSTIPTKGPIQGTRGKDPEAMNHLKLRTTSGTTVSTQNQQAPVKPVVKPVAQPSPSPPPPPNASPPSPPQPLVVELVPEPTPAQPSVSTPTPPPQAPPTPPSLNPQEIPSAQSPRVVAGHKRKRSSASSPPPPSSPPAGRVKSSDSTISPNSAVATSPVTIQRGSASTHTPAPPPPSEAHESPTQLPDAKPAAAPPAQEPTKRRGRPPGSFKVNSSKRKHAAKMAKLADAEKAEAAAAAASASVEKVPEEKDEEGEWEEDMEVYEHEPTYCICNRVSHGLMLGCENDECDLQWFHLGCLGLTKPPPQKVPWFCPLCREGGENGNPSVKARGAGKGVVKGQKKKRRKFK